MTMRPWYSPTASWQRATATTGPLRPPSDVSLAKLWEWKQDRHEKLRYRRRYGHFFLNVVVLDDASDFWWCCCCCCLFRFWWSAWSMWGISISVILSASLPTFAPFGFRFLPWLRKKTLSIFTHLKISSILQSNFCKLNCYLQMVQFSLFNLFLDVTPQNPILFYIIWDYYMYWRNRSIEQFIYLEGINSETVSYLVILWPHE